MGRLSPPPSAHLGVRASAMASLSSPACPPPRAAPRALARGGRSRRLGSRAFASSSTPAPSPDAFRALEAEIDAAGSPSSSGASARLTLADAVWKVSRDAPMSLRDRAACAIAAEATQALCDAGLDGAGLLAVLAVREAMRRNGFDRGDGRVRPVAGFKVFAAADEDDPRESTAPAGSPKYRAAAAPRRTAGWRSTGACWTSRRTAWRSATPRGDWASTTATPSGWRSDSERRRCARGVRAPRRAPARRAGRPGARRGNPNEDARAEAHPRDAAGARRGREGGGGARRRVQGDARGGRPKGRGGGERGRPRGGNAAGGGGGVPARRGGRHRDGQGREGARGEAQRRRSLAEEDEERSRVGN